MQAIIHTLLPFLWIHKENGMSYDWRRHEKELALLNVHLIAIYLHKIHANGFVRVPGLYLFAKTFLCVRYSILQKKVPTAISCLQPK